MGGIHASPFARAPVHPGLARRLESWLAPAYLSRMYVAKLRLLAEAAAG
jgi:hypothetical protein